MKRHSALIPLSGDDHEGLVQALRLRRAAADGDASARLVAARDFVEFFRNEERVHLRDQEEELFPLFVRHVQSQPAPLQSMDVARWSYGRRTLSGPDTGGIKADRRATDRAEMGYVFGRLMWLAIVAMAAVFVALGVAFLRLNDALWKRSPLLAGVTWAAIFVLGYVTEGTTGLPWFVPPIIVALMLLAGLGGHYEKAGAKNSPVVDVEAAVSVTSARQAHELAPLIASGKLEVVVEYRGQDVTVVRTRDSDGAVRVRFADGSEKWVSQKSLSSPKVA